MTQVNPLLLIVLLLGTWTTEVSAQNIGDRVRVRSGDQAAGGGFVQIQRVGSTDVEDRSLSAWTEGRLEMFDAGVGTLRVRNRLEDPASTFRVGEIERADWYKPRPLARDLLLGAAAVIAFEALVPCGPDAGTFGRTCYSDDRATQYAIDVAIVAGFTLFVHAIKPGRWTRWIEDGIVLP